MNFSIFKFLFVSVLILSLPACSWLHRDSQTSAAFYVPVSEEKMQQDIEVFVQSKVVNSPTPAFLASKIIPLPLNEQLVYKVKWFGLTIGTVAISIKSLEMIQDRPAYKVEALAKTAGFFKLWPVNDRFVSYMDAENLSILRNEVYRREGKYKKDAVIDFAQEKGQAHYQHLFDGTNKIYDVPPKLHDALTSVYYFRANNLEAGDQFRFLAYVDEKSYEISGEIEAGDPVKISGIGILPSYSVKPQARCDNEDINNGSAQLFLSADARKIPLKAVVKGPIFSSVTFTLDQINREG